MPPLGSLNTKCTPHICHVCNVVFCFWDGVFGFWDGVFGICDCVIGKWVGVVGVWDVI